MQDFSEVSPTYSVSQLEAMALALLEAMLANQDPQWGGGQMSASAYDTAWVAMVRDHQNPDRLAFPQAFAWLLNHQNSNGSFGGPDSYALLPTLAGLLALLKAPAPSPQIQAAAARAEAYLEQSLSEWSVTTHESVGFEILAPGLLAELEKLGRDFDFPDKPILLSLYAEKLLIAGPDLIYRNRSNLIHSLEGFGPYLDFTRLKCQQANNGSYGCSPAATAAVLIYGPEWDEDAAAWLAHLVEQGFEDISGAMPDAYPIDTFECSSVLYHLAHGGFFNGHHQKFPKEVMTPLLDWLQASLTRQGGSISRLLGMPNDAAHTAMIVAALNLAGVATPVDSLLHFERDQYFACFERERGASLSANAYVLSAMLSRPLPVRSRLASSISKVVAFLYDQRDPQGFWEDKWHLSPYYATACVGLALASHDSPAVRRKLQPTLDWMLATQSVRDGGWSIGDFSTMEETAYAVQFLQAVSDLVAPAERSRYDFALERGREYLWQQLETQFPTNGIGLPRLWRGKELYTPARVVFAVTIAALAR
jgi:halimadienyl-diphosphate synthase